MQVSYYLGIDIGTTSAKAVAFSITGRVLFSCTEYYSMLHPAPGESEQNAKEVYEAVVKSCNRVVLSMNGTAPVFVALSAAMHSIMAIDECGAPITNCIIWADNRAAPIADELHNTQKAYWYYNRTGVPVHAMSPLCKLLWWQRYQPGLFKQAAKFIGIKEFVCHMFTGQYLVDSSVASSTGLLNIETLQWDQEILNGLDLSLSSLAEVVPPTYKTSFKTIVAHNGYPALLIPEGTPLVMGGSDGAMANLGAGAADGNTMVVTIGTSSAARIVVNKPDLDPQMRTFCYHLKDELYIIGGPSNNGAVVMEWLKDQLLQSPDTFSGLFSKAEKIDPGSESLLFLPYILGERAPVWNSNARGVFFGLDINHTQSHLVRACMEGVIFGLYSIARIVFEKRTINGIHATGGFAQSKLWLQMLADVCYADVSVSAATETSALGAIMIGVEALGLEPIHMGEFIPAYKPDSASHLMYMKCFGKFEKLYHALQQVWIEPSLQPEEILV